MELDRVPTGIIGFDELVEGGLPKGSSLLLSGPCGAGKLYFASEFLYRSEEPALFYTFEKDEADLKKSLSIFDWDLDAKIKKNQFNVIKSELYQFQAFASDLEDNINKLNAKRIVLDSLTVLGQFCESSFKMRKDLVDLKRIIKDADCTALFLSEIPDQSSQLSSFGSEEFVLDGVILMHVIRKDSNFLRAVSVRKLVGTNHDTTIHPYELTKKGLKVHRIREII